MNEPTSALIVVEWVGTARPEEIKVRYNPTEFSLDKGVQLAEVAIPGLNAPLQQFVRGQAEKLTVELYFDTTDSGTGDGARPVTEETDRLLALALIEPAAHAPPIVTFYWGPGFPGSRLSEPAGNQRRNAFRGLVESVRQKFTLFSPSGVPLRATVSLTLREFTPLHEQLSRENKHSPDRSQAHVLAEGDTLAHLAARYYLRAQAWRPIAEANGIDDPRRLDPGRVLVIPALVDLGSRA